MCSVPSSLTQFSASLLLPSLCSWLSLTSSPAPTTSLWGPQWPMLSTHLTRHSTLYIPHITPDPNSWSENFWSAQVHLTKLGSVIPFSDHREPDFHLRFCLPSTLFIQPLWNSASFWGWGLQWPHPIYFQDKTTMNYQDNKCICQFSPPPIEHPQAKNPWWMDSQLKFLAPTWLRKLHDHYNRCCWKGQSWSNHPIPCQT